MKLPLSHAHILTAIATLCMGALAPAHATITVGTVANCPAGGIELNNYSSSYTRQSPPLAEWSFQLTHTIFSANPYGPKTVTGTMQGAGYIEGHVYYANDFPVYYAVGNHYGFDGFARYSVTTSASTCSGDIRVYQTAQRASGLTATATLEGAPNAQFHESSAEADAVQPITRGVRVDIAAHVIPQAQINEQRREWNSNAAQATAMAVAQMLTDPATASIERGLSVGSERLSFSVANVGSSELAKVSAAKTLPAGARQDNGWTGVSRIFRLSPTDWVMLEELDLEAMQGAAVIMREAINSDVNGNPAMLRTASGPLGARLTALTWLANGKRYSLKSNLPLATAADRLLAIGRSLY